jgi:hypothetical protein
MEKFKIYVDGYEHTCTGRYIEDAVWNYCRLLFKPMSALEQLQDYFPKNRDEVNIETECGRAYEACIASESYINGNVNRFSVMISRTDEERLDG